MLRLREHPGASAAKTINTDSSTVTVAVNQSSSLPSGNNWFFGAGSSPLSVNNIASITYGTMAVWYLSNLQLSGGRTYRFDYSTSCTTAIRRGRARARRR